MGAVRVGLLGGVLAVGLLIGRALWGVASAQPAIEWLGRVDHLVYATPDLAAGIARIERLLGVSATPGGQHPGRGTRNALVAIGPATYIEIIGPDRDQATPQEPRPFTIDSLSEPRLVTWAAKESDLESLTKRASAQGIALGDLQPGSRRRPDGLLLTWRYTNPRVVVENGLVPFFIDWGKTPHPAASAVSGGRLVALRAEHPMPERVTAALGHLGLPMQVTKGASPALIATIETARGRVDLR
jgi:hypothetical protein